MPLSGILSRAAAQGFIVQCNLLCYPVWLSELVPWTLSLCVTTTNLCSFGHCVSPRQYLSTLRVTNFQTNHKFGQIASQALCPLVCTAAGSTPSNLVRPRSDYTRRKGNNVPILSPASDGLQHRNEPQSLLQNSRASAWSVISLICMAEVV